MSMDNRRNKMSKEIEMLERDLVLARKQKLEEKLKIICNDCEIKNYCTKYNHAKKHIDKEIKKYKTNKLKKSVLKKI
jgi:hypothetical protein